MSYQSLLEAVVEQMKELRSENARLSEENAQLRYELARYEAVERRIRKH